MADHPGGLTPGDGPTSCHRHQVGADHKTVRRLCEEARGERREEALQELLELLPGHFAYEERPGGFFERMVVLGHDPKEAKRLMDEHATLLESLHAAVEAAPEELDELVDDLVRHLERHEWDENKFATASPLFADDRSRFGG